VSLLSDLTVVFDRVPQFTIKSLSALLTHPRTSTRLGSTSIASSNGLLGLSLSLPLSLPLSPSLSLSLSLRLDIHLRNENGKFHDNALEKALECVDAAIALTEERGEAYDAGSLLCDSCLRYRA
jgi:hypothetical protein